MKCENCGAESTDKFCPYCGSEMPYSGPNTVIINNYYNGDSNKSEDDTFRRSSTKKRVYYSSKRKSVALLLCIFLGIVGAHYFYVGKVGKGILFLFTGGLFGIGWIVDICIILSGNFTDNRGSLLDDSKMTQNEKNAVFLVLTIIGIIGLIMGISSFEAELIIFYLIWSGIFVFLYYRGKKSMD